MRSCYIDYDTRGIADLCDYYDQGLILTRINVPAASRGQGVARKLLKEICDDADAEGVTLYLEISPSDGLTSEQLEAWYLRHGFKRWYGIFRRRPQEAQNATQPQPIQQDRSEEA